MAEQMRADETEAITEKSKTGSLGDFFSRVFVSALLWFCVGVGLMLFPVFASNMGATTEVPKLATNISIFYDERLVWAILGGGVVIYVVFSFVHAVDERLRKTPRKPGDVPLLTALMVELANQLIGFSTLLGVSYGFYRLAGDIFAPLANEPPLFPALMMFIFAAIIYWIAHAGMGRAAANQAAQSR